MKSWWGSDPLSWLCRGQRVHADVDGLNGIAGAFDGGRVPHVTRTELGPVAPEVGGPARIADQTSDPHTRLEQGGHESAAEKAGGPDGQDGAVIFRHESPGSRPLS